MAHIMDGSTGSAHISSKDWAVFNRATYGVEGGVFAWGDGFRLTMSTANKGTIGTGAALVAGRRAWVEAPEAVTVESGGQGVKRNDVVGLQYEAYESGGATRERVSVKVVKGTPRADAAADPKAPAGFLPLWRVPLDGLNVGEPVRLYGDVPSVTGLRESVARLEEDTGLVYLYDTDQGSVSWRAVGGVCTLYVQAVSGMSSGEEWKVPGVIPARYRPKVSVYAPLAYRRRNSLGTAWVPSDANKDQSVYIYAADDTTAKENTIYGVVSWGY